jgi:hypothetical protein
VAIEVRNGVRVGTYVSGSGPVEVLVVVLSPDDIEGIAKVVEEYGRDVAHRLADGWSLLAMTMYPIGHRAGAGYPGMDLDKAMAVVTYRRADLAANQPHDM